MNIYLVKRTDDWSYDDYDSCVIIAKNEEEAEIMTHPPKFNRENKTWFYEMPYGTVSSHSGGDVYYTDNGQHTITLIGKSNVTEPQVICASFNAG